MMFVFFKQKTAYEMRISDWSSDVCSSDLGEWLPDGDAEASLKKGHLNFTLHGARLQGRWSLIRTRLSGRQPQWLLMKGDDDATQAGDVADDTDRKSTRLNSSH